MSWIDVAGKFGAGFARDRSDFSGRNFDPERLRAVLPIVRDQAYGQLSLAEAMLADGRRFVLGAEPSMPDCALYNRCGSFSNTWASRQVRSTDCPGSSPGRSA